MANFLKPAVLSALALVAGIQQAFAVSISDGAPESEITLRTENAPLSEVVGELQRRFGFTVKGIEHIASVKAAGETYSGNLEEVLRRLLRDTNYVMICKENRPVEVVSVIFIDRKAGSKPVLPAAERQETRSEGVRRSTRPIAQDPDNPSHPLTRKNTLQRQ